LYPFEAQYLTTAEPTLPLAPVIAIFMVSY
jgi:hypothetical protein